MVIAPITLEGSRVRLEPLRPEHVRELRDVAFHPAIWRYTTDRVATEEQLARYLETAQSLAAAGAAMVWVTRRLDPDLEPGLKQGKVVGMTRFADINHAHRTLELGWTWIHPDHQRTGVNVEAKYLQLSHAFERMGARRVALKTHHENLPSQNAMRAIGAKPEGTFRNHMIMPDGSTRHSVWFSVIAEEWPEVKQDLEGRMGRHVR